MTEDGTREQTAGSDPGTLQAVSPAGEQPAGTQSSGPLPPIPEDIKKAARLAPNHWLAAVDPGWSGEGAPPLWAVPGQWRSDSSGEVVEFRENKQYRPSPRALGWPAPGDPVDAAVQLAATGYGPESDVAEALAEAEVAVLVDAEESLVSWATRSGDPVVPAFTAPAYLNMVGPVAYELFSMDELVELLPEGHRLHINPTGPVGMMVTQDAVRKALADLDEDEFDEDEFDEDEFDEDEFDEDEPGEEAAAPAATPVVATAPARPVPAATAAAPDNPTAPAPAP